MWNELRRYRQSSSLRRQLLREALCALAVARLAMACLPFRRIAQWLGTPGAASQEDVSAEQIALAQDVGWAVSALGKRVPWDGRCLAQALAATAMLRRRGIEGTVSFGAREGERAALEAHAWLRVGECIVTGAAGHQQFKVFTTFSRTRP